MIAPRKLDIARLMQDRRRARRARVALSGVLTWAPYTLHVVCSVVDISQSGARLRCCAGMLADDFYLYLSAQDMVAPARTAWRSSREIGVEFADEFRDVSQCGEPGLADLTAALRHLRKAVPDLVPTGK